MLPFLSPEWLAAFDAVLRADSTLAGHFTGAPIAIAQEITLDGAPSVRYVVVLDAAGGRVLRGRDDSLPAPDVTFVSDRATAVGLAQGTLNAQRALTTGRLKLRGEVDRLAAASDALAGLGDLLGALRADTRF